jgi:hypothetical protein
MSDTQLTTKQAEERAYKRFLKVKGHQPKIIWSGPSTYQWEDGAMTFQIECSCGVPCHPGWRTPKVNADGSIGRMWIGWTNDHLRACMEEARDQGFYEDAKLLMRVPMLRGQDHEWWAVSSADTDFWEAIGHQARKGNPRWRVAWKNSRGKWKVWGWYEELDGLAGEVMRRKVAYERQGKIPLVFYSTDVGAQSPAVTIELAVRRLIDDYAAVEDKSNPLVVKPWLDKVTDSLTHVELLTQLHKEVQLDLMESMEL